MEEKLVNAMTKCINNIWNGKGIPEEWKTLVIKPIYKKGDVDNTENYRGVTLIDAGYKIYA